MAARSRGPSLQASIRKVFNDYRYNCKTRNIFWGLTLEQVCKLISQKCCYCGCPPASMRIGYPYNGIDRKDNKRGYTPDNVDTCCKACNSIKGEHLTYKEMQAVAKTLKNYRRS